MLGDGGGRGRSSGSGDYCGGRDVGASRSDDDGAGGDAGCVGSARGRTPTGRTGAINRGVVDDSGGICNGFEAGAICEDATIPATDVIYDVLMRAEVEFDSQDETVGPFFGDVGGGDVVPSVGAAVADLPTIAGDAEGAN